MFNLKGGDSDFNDDWFANIGDTIVGSMVFNVFFPVVMEVLYFSIRSLKRILDSVGKEIDDVKYQTKCVSIQ